VAPEARGRISVLKRVIACLLPWVPRSLVARIARRYVAGEQRSEVLEVAQRLASKRIDATIDLLGENATERSDVERVTAEYRALIDDIARVGGRAQLSVKLTHLGLRLSEDLARDELAKIVLHAEKAGNFVCIDMEDTSTTDVTLRIFRDLRLRSPAVGVAIQAYLRRSPADIESIGDLQPTVRICKGIYREPPELTLPNPAAIRQAYLDLARRLIELGGKPAFATHDPWLVDRCLELVRARELSPNQHEFQMLLGVGHALRPRIEAAGSPLRLYLPYGPDWYEYSLRRLRENPSMAGYVVRALFRPPQHD
jgi:proline dehydrogenase